MPHGQKSGLPKWTGSRGAGCGCRLALACCLLAWSLPSSGALPSFKAFPSFATPPPEKKPELATVLVKNAMLADPGAEGESRAINLLIEKGRLKMITADAVPEDSVGRVVDARQGHVLGQLEVGGFASFMILDQNPIEQFEALLDTKSHAVFVVKEGYVVRNRLLPVAKSQPSEKKKEWFAYSAPPFALPTVYQNKKRWNRYDGKYATANFIAGLLLDRVDWLSQNGASEGQVGDLSAHDGGEIRALRFGVVGALKFEHPWIYTFFVATHAFDQGFDSSDNDDELTIFDLRLDVPLYKDTSLAIGKQKEPISMERLMALVDLPMQERSAVSDAMMPSRNVGIVLSGTGFDRRCSWAGGVFNPWLDQSGSISENATQVVGRGTVVALASTDESSLMHLGVGVRYSNLRKGAQYRSTPEFNEAPLFVDTGLAAADSSILYDLEAAWRWGSLWLNGEYVLNRVDAADSLVFHGFHATASYVLTGEMRPYNKRNGLFRPVPVAKPVTRGGWGAWEAVARFSAIDLQEKNLDGGDMDIYSLGLNWKLTSVTSLSVNYRHVVLDQAGETGRSDGVMMRVALMLE